MAREPTIQDAVVGYVLPELGRLHRGVLGTGAKGAAAHLGSPSRRSTGAMFRNAARVPQSVVKRVKAGGTKTPAELRRQLEYVTRDDGVQASWMNFNGTERTLPANATEKTVQLWTSSWVGCPQRGHTDHIIVSFPKGVELEAAEAISREWGRAVFASGDFGDQWRYVAGLHKDTDHYHAHFVVDKRGIDFGQFLSISRKAELNFEVMRELHASIAGKHGVALNASSRLSRGIVENPPRETEFRAAHAAGKTAAAPEMLEAEKKARAAVVRSFAAQYRNLGKLAALAAGEDGGGFMARIQSLFEDAAEKLVQGVPLLSSTDTATPRLDPTDRLARAQESLLGAAKEAWEEIRGMEPGAERATLEAEFGGQTREVRSAAINDPFFTSHGQVLSANNDPYGHSLVRDLQASRDGADGDAVLRLDEVLDGLRDRLQAAFTVHEERLRPLATSSEEMAERYMLGERTAGQVESWRNQSNSADGASYLEAERDLGSEARRIIGDYEVPRDIQEIVARDRLLGADPSQRLAEVPAIEAIVERVARDLSPDDLAAVRAGDATALHEAIKDPTIRAAVASELRNEADAGPDATRQSAPVGQFQALARANALDGREAGRSASVPADDYGL